ncbi:MAG: polyprenyl synthetase family protein [Chloroflexi bacterium]|nr:polyprenyl synthetase family protein [Chloroflexota bacterium]
MPLERGVPRRQSRRCGTFWSRRSSTWAGDNTRTFAPSKVSTIPSLGDYLEMVRLKTGALLGTACQAGGLVAHTMEKRAVARRFGEALGMAFQLQDDSLEVWGAAATLGKLPEVSTLRDSPADCTAGVIGWRRFRVKRCRSRGPGWASESSSSVR